MVSQQALRLPGLSSCPINCPLVIVRRGTVPSVDRPITRIAYLGIAVWIFVNGFSGAFHGIAGGATTGITAAFVNSRSVTYRKEWPMETLEQQSMKRCWKCQGLLKAETVIDWHSNLSIQQFVCLSCGRPWPAGVKLRR